MKTLSFQTSATASAEPKNEIPPSLGLYVHIPWCIKKCPYCDFNSHQKTDALPEKDYLKALIEDLTLDLPLINERPITSIFFGGGTPSLMSSDFFYQFLAKAQQLIHLSKEVEITLEANPGTLECSPFLELKEAGINRISLGIQSLNSDNLVELGRIHDKESALLALEGALSAGFRSVNADLMHALPGQNTKGALAELKQLIDLKVPHISWYQLTIEPNTVFFNRPPKGLPSLDLTADMTETGTDLLKAQGYEHYEVSAFSQPNHQCKHNLNYWQFGDYLGIGAGAHGKITRPCGQVIRTTRTRMPNHYLEQTQPQGRVSQKTVPQSDLLFEYCLNRFRLFSPISLSHLCVLGQVSQEVILNTLAPAFEKGWITLEKNGSEIYITNTGKNFLDTIIGLFL